MGGIPCLQNVCGVSRGAAVALRCVLRGTFSLRKKKFWNGDSGEVYDRGKSNSETVVEGECEQGKMTQTQRGEVEGSAKNR